MFEKPLFKESLLLLAFVYILNQLGLGLGLFLPSSPMQEYDSLVHFFGGITVGLGILWFYFYSGLFQPNKKGFYNYLLIEILGIVFVGISWEIFEIVAGITSVTDKVYFFDTLLDFIMNFLGATTACFYGYIKEISPVDKPVEIS